MGIFNTARRGARLAIVGLVVTSGVAIAQPASAAGPPAPDSGLIGTWTIDGAVGPIGLAKLVIASDGAGGIKVDTFGKCGAPPLCEYGSVPALVFGPTANSLKGQFFETNQVFAAYNKVLLGHLTATAAGPRITVQRYIAWTDHSRRNSSLGYTFKPVSVSTAGVTKAGTATTAFPAAFQAMPTDSLIGVWHNTSTTIKAVAELDITRAGDGSLVIHAFGACTPTLCDIGSFPGITYGPNSLSATGARFLAPHDAGFKRELYAGKVLPGGNLSVDYYSEFTDSSGRSNYSLTETFAK